MRGNEALAAGITFVEDGWFTIPMRGNESLVQGDWMPIIAEVYDPHEG